MHSHFGVIIKLKIISDLAWAWSISMESEHTAEEAMLAGAGCASPTEEADFRVERVSETNWRIVAQTLKASRWLQAEFCPPLAQCGIGDITIDAVSTNVLLKKVHAEGLRIAFVGKHRWDRY